MGSSNDSTSPTGSLLEDARVRDRRRASWFSVDNEVLDDFGPRIGAHGFAVYCALARHARAGDDRTQVSVRRLCKQLKMGTTKLLQTLDELREVGLIAIERGDYETINTYTLLQVPKGVPNQEQGGPNEEQGVPDQEQYKTNKTNKMATSGSSGKAKLLGWGASSCAIQNLLRILGRQTMPGYSKGNRPA
jgi:hypothetical protein